MTNKLNLKTAIKAALLGGSALLAGTQTALAIDNPLSDPLCRAEHKLNL